MHQPTIQQMSTAQLWARRTGLAVTAAETTPGGVRLTYAHCRDCLTPLRADGSCGPCTALADPLTAALCDAVERGDDRAAAAAEAAAALRARDAAAPFNGCAQCDRLEAEHRPVGRRRGHGWDAPTDRLRLARVRARRATRATHKIT